jgi:cardiolipin synthase
MLRYFFKLCFSRFKKMNRLIIKLSLVGLSRGSSTTFHHVSPLSSSCFGVKLLKCKHWTPRRECSFLNNQQRRFLSNQSNNDATQTDNNNRILTIPNVLTCSRIASIPFINYFFLTSQDEYACTLFILAALTDFLDGYIARNFKNQSSYLGGIIDPLADKLLIGSLVVTLGYMNMLPLELVTLILARDLSLILASVYVRFKVVEKPVTWSKFVNINKYSTIKVEADLISKVNTFFQLALITATLPSGLFAYQNSAFLISLQYLTGLTTVASSISYLYKRGSYKVIEPEKKKPPQ